MEPNDSQHGNGMDETIKNGIPSLENLIEEGKNKENTFCNLCSCRILNSGNGILKEVEFRLPDMMKKAKCNEDHTSEEITHVWLVNDMLSFENIGVSKSVNGIKYLTCADCEMGPIGWMDLETNISYLAITRVKHGY
uniref:Mss4-like protein n=1 Tax=Clastoptera arizonana TaxID=38151 RepID=A0A1B6DET8_9HEMI